MCGIFLTFLSSGVPLVISRYTAQANINKTFKKSHKIVSAGIFVSIILSIIVTISILILKPLFMIIFTDSTSYIVLLTLIPMLVSSAIYAPIKGYLWGLEDYFLVSLVEVIEQIIKFIACLLLFALIPNRNLPAGLSISIACIFSTIVGFVFYFKKSGKLGLPNKGHVKSIFESSMPITSIRVVASLLPPLISIIIPLMLVNAGYSNDQALSELGILMGMTFPILTIPTTLVGSLAMALIPKLTVLQQSTQDTSKELGGQIRNSLTFTLFCCFIFVPLFLSLGKPICAYLFNNVASGVYLELFGWVVVPMGLSLITTSILNSLSQEKFVFKSYFISASLMLLSIIFLPKFIGVSALLVGLALQNISVTIINLLKLKSILKDKNISISGLIIKFSIVSAISGYLSKWIYLLIGLSFSNLLGLIIFSIINIFSFLILCYCFNIFNLQMLLQLKQNKIKKV